MDIVLTHSAPLWDLPAHNPRCLEAMIYLELCKIPYERRICVYNINPLGNDSELPLARVDDKSITGGYTGGIVDWLEGSRSGLTNDSSSSSSSSSSGSASKTIKLNDCLSPSEKADVAPLQGLVRDRLHMVTLHQLYANEENWIDYCQAMSRHLPLFVRQWYLKKERENALKQLRKYQIITTKQALDLLKDCLDTLTVKFPSHDDDIDRDEQEKEEDQSKIMYFFGENRPTSLDAVLVSELMVLSCCKMSHKYIDEDSIAKDEKYQKLLNYAKRVFSHHYDSMKQKLKSTQYPYKSGYRYGHYQPSTTRSFKYEYPFSYTPQGFWKWMFGDGKSATPSDKLSDDSQTSLVYLLGSLTLVAIYWKCFQPVNAITSKLSQPK